jgi:hypothetical protein
MKVFGMFQVQFVYTEFASPPPETSSLRGFKSKATL